MFPIFFIVENITPLLKQTIFSFYFRLTYSEDKRQFSARNRDVLLNAQFHHKWWSTLKFAVLGLSSSLPPLVGGGGQCWWRWQS